MDDVKTLLDRRAIDDLLARYCRTLDCLDEVVTHGPLRAALLDPRMRVMGGGAQLAGGKVHLVINLAAE